MKVEFELNPNEVAEILKNFVEHRFQPPPNEGWEWEVEVPNGFEEGLRDPLPYVWVTIKDIEFKKGASE